MKTKNAPKNKPTTQNKPEFNIEDHYTPKGEHPEDRIFKDKEFIKELERVQSQYFDKLSQDLNLNQKGEDFLFDYVHNCEENICFDEYLETFGLSYQECTKSNE